MKKKNQLLNILTAFLAAIGLCAAALVAFIIIYTGINGSFPSKSGSDLSQESDTVQAENSGNENFGASVLAMADGSESTESAPSPTTLPAVTIESGSYQVNGIEFWFSDSVINDETGKWKISTMSDMADITEYAAGYYQKLFSSDDEIHAIVNYAANTTGSISMQQDGTLNVSVYEHVDGEEHDAKSLFGGMLLAEYKINPETGEIQTNNQETPSASTAQDTQTVQDTQTTQNMQDTQTVQGETTNNFNTYDNSEQQNTTDAYVLNTESKVLHRPTCSDVSKIAPQNYDTSSSILSDLISQGYTVCGNCFS